jgi:hypothetical protein
MFAVLSSIKINKSSSTGTEIVKLVKMGSSKDIAAIHKKNYKVFNKINIQLQDFLPALPILGPFLTLEAPIENGQFHPPVRARAGARTYTYTHTHTKNNNNNNNNNN